MCCTVYAVPSPPVSLSHLWNVKVWQGRIACKILLSLISKGFFLEQIQNENWGETAIAFLHGK